MALYYDLSKVNSKNWKQIFQLQILIISLRELARIIKVPIVGPRPSDEAFLKLSLSIINDKLKGNPSPQPNRPNVKLNLIDSALVKNGVDIKLLKEALSDTKKAFAEIQDLIDRDIQTLNGLK